MIKLRDCIQLVFSKNQVLIFDSLSNEYISVDTKLNVLEIESIISTLKQGLEEDMITFNNEDTNLFIQKIPNIFFVKNASIFEFGPTIRNLIKIESICGDSMLANLKIKQIEGMHIVILGVGSLGCHIIQNLLFLGVKNFTFIDYDIVEESNLNRQILFNYNDLGSKKTYCAKRYVKKYNSKITINCINKMISDSESLSNLINNADFLFLTADKPDKEISKICADACIGSRVPWVRINRNGHGPFWAGDNSACPNCYYLKSLGKVKNYSAPHDQNINKSLGVLNFEISYRVSLLIKDFVNFIIDSTRVKGKYCHVRIFNSSFGEFIKYEKVSAHFNCPCSNTFN